MGEEAHLASALAALDAHLCAVLGGVQVDLEDAVRERALVAQGTEAVELVVRAGFSQVPAVPWE